MAARAELSACDPDESSKGLHDAEEPQNEDDQQDRHDGSNNAVSHGPLLHGLARSTKPCFLED